MVNLGWQVNPVYKQLLADLVQAVRVSLGKDIAQTAVLIAARVVANVADVQTIAEFATRTGKQAEATTKAQSVANSPFN